MRDDGIGRSKGQLTADKFRWLQQVASDRKLSATAVACAIMMASKYWNSGTEEIYPAALTVAKDVDRGLTQTRAGIDKLVDCGHLEMVSAGGGARNPNRYKALLKPIGNPIGNDDPKPTGNPIGSRHKNVSGIRAKRTGNPTGKPIGNPIQNPLIESFDESASSGRHQAGLLSAVEQQPASTSIGGDSQAHRDDLEDHPRATEAENAYLAMSRGQ